MIKMLKIAGVILIVSGVIFALTQVSSLTEEYEGTVFWQESAEENWDNDLIEEQYLVEKNIFMSHLTLTIGSLTSSILVGVFFFALSKIIELLEGIKRIVVKSEGE